MPANSNPCVAFVLGLQAMIKCLHLPFRLACAPTKRPTIQSLARSSTDTYGQWAFGRLSLLLQTKAARVAGREDGGLRPLGIAAFVHFRGELEAACAWTDAPGY